MARVDQQALPDILLQMKARGNAEMSLFLSLFIFWCLMNLNLRAFHLVYSPCEFKDSLEILWYMNLQKES